MGRIRTARSLELPRRSSVPLRSRAARFLISVLLPASAACGGAGPEEPAATPCPEVVGIKVSAPVLEALRLDRWATVTEEERRAGFIGAEAISDERIARLYPDIVRTLERDGYVFLGGDNEGFEAEISFKDEKGRHISFALRQHPCDSSRVVLQVLVQGRV